MLAWLAAQLRCCSCAVTATRRELLTGADPSPSAGYMLNLAALCVGLDGGPTALPRVHTVHEDAAVRSESVSGKTRRGLAPRARDLCVHRRIAGLCAPLLKDDGKKLLKLVATEGSGGGGREDVAYLTQPHNYRIPDWRHEQKLGNAAISDADVQGAEDHAAAAEAAEQDDDEEEDDDEDDDDEALRQALAMSLGVSTAKPHFLPTDPQSTHRRFKSVSSARACAARAGPAPSVRNIDGDVMRCAPRRVRSIGRLHLGC